MSETAITVAPAEVKTPKSSDAHIATCLPPIKKAPFLRDLGRNPLFILIGTLLLFLGGGILGSLAFSWDQKNTSYQQTNLQPSPRSIRSFQAEKFERMVDPKTFQTLDWVVITYAGRGVALREGSLSNCDVTLTVCYDNGEVKEVKRFFGVWRPGEKKNIDIPSHGRSIQRVDFQGSAEEGYAPVHLSGYDFLWAN